MIKFIKKLLKKKESPVSSIGKTEGIVTPVKNTDFLPSKEQAKLQSSTKKIDDKKIVELKKVDSNSTKKSTTVKKAGRPKGPANKTKTDKK